MSESVGKIQLDLETNYGPFQQQLNGIAGKSTNLVTAAFSKLGGVIAGAFAVSKLVAFGKASIDMASDLQEVQNVVDVVFGQSASQINNFAKSAITSYGLSELSAKRYSSTMGAMLKSMGLSEDNVLNMSQSITALAGDMASFYNLNSDDAFNKIRAGISGETEPLKQLGINMSQANLEAFALSQGITKSVQSMTQSEQALLRYNYLLSVTSDAQGDFYRTQDSWANQTRILTEQMNSLKATLGSAFLALLTPVVRLLNSFVAKLQIAAAYFTAFVEALTGVKAESDSTTSGFENMTEGAEETAEAATKAKKALAGFDKLNVLSSDSGDAKEDAGGNALFNVPEFAANTAIEIPAPDVSGVETSIATIKGLFSGLLEFLTPVGEAFKTVFTDVGNSISAEWEKSGTNIINNLLGFVDSFKGIWDSLYTSIIQPIMQGIAETLDWLWNSHLKSFCDSVVQLVSKIIEFVLRLWNYVLAPLVEWVVSILGPFIANVVNHIVSVVSTTISIIADVLGGIMTALGGVLDFLIGVFTGDWKRAWEGIKNIFKGVWEALWGVVKGIINRIIDALNLLWGALYSVVAGIINGIGGIAGAIGALLGKDWKFSMPTKPPYIPKLARGGIIDQPTLAMVGEAGKEAVVPLENTAFADSIANAIMRVLMPLLSNGKGTGKNTDDSNTPIILKVGEYELGRITVSAINKYHNVIGKVELEV